MPIILPEERIMNDLLMILLLILELLVDREVD